MLDIALEAQVDEVAAIQKSGIGADYIEKVKELRLRAHETNLRENGYWLRELERSYMFGDDPKTMLDWGIMRERVSSDRVRAAANRYLSSKQYTLGELRPETSLSAAAR